MAIWNRDKKIDVIFWANLNPNKRGSFEDYICHLASNCELSGVDIKFILGNDINNSLKKLFCDFKVDFMALDSMKLFSLMEMMKILKKTHPRIIHFNFLGHASPLILICKVMGVNKIILTEHASTPLFSDVKKNKGIREPLKRLRRSVSTKKIDHFIAVSNFVAKRLEQRNRIPAKKISTIYNGIDLERFRPPANELEKIQLKKDLFDVDPSMSVVTFIGQLIEEKGLSVFLESIHKLVKSHKDIIFVFVGAGPMESLLVNMIQTSQNGMIKFLGVRDDAELIIRASDIVVAPSVWEEAFGLVIAEASACGVPVIGTKIGGIPEVILDRETGILVRPRDVDELADAIEQLVYDKELKKYYSEMGRKHVENKFDLKIQVSETIKLYKHF